MEIINLTGTNISFVSKTGEEIVEVKFDPSNKILCLSEKLENSENRNIDGIPLLSFTVSVESLPPQLPNTMYLVNRDVLMLLPSGRKDFLTFSDEVMQNGNVIGYKSYCKITH